MQDLDWKWLKNQCMSWLKDKCNDWIAIENNTKLREQAYEKGFTSEQVSKAIHKCRKILDDEKCNIQHSEQPVPESKSSESTPEPQKEEVRQMPKVPMQKLSERTTESDRTASGTVKTGKYKGPSILDRTEGRI